MITCKPTGMSCECGNTQASKFTRYIHDGQKKEGHLIVSFKTNFIRCTVCSDMIDEEEMNKQLNAQSN